MQQIQISLQLITNLITQLINWILSHKMTLQLKILLKMSIEFRTKNQNYLTVATDIAHLISVQFLQTYHLVKLLT